MVKVCPVFLFFVFIHLFKHFFGSFSDKIDYFAIESANEQDFIVEVLLTFRNSISLQLYGFLTNNFIRKCILLILPCS